MKARFLALACLVACSKRDSGPRLRAWQPATNLPPACSQIEWPGIDRTVDIDVYRGPGVDAELVREQMATAAALWRNAGVRLRSPTVGSVALAAANTREDGFGPLSEIVAEHGRADRWLLLVLPRIAGPRSPLRGHLPDLSGLTVTPALARELDIPAPAPVVLLSARDVRLSPGMHGRATLAHELGHALGFGHAPAYETGDLMAVKRDPSCAPALSK